MTQTTHFINNGNSLMARTDEQRRHIEETMYDEDHVIEIGGEDVEVFIDGSISYKMAEVVDYLRNGIKKEDGTMDRPTEVYLCVLRRDDGTFKAIVGCFYDYDKAVRYADRSPRITFHKQNVI